MPPKTVWQEISEKHHSKVGDKAKCKDVCVDVWSGWIESGLRSTPATAQARVYNEAWGYFTPCGYLELWQVAQNTKKPEQPQESPRDINSVHAQMHTHTYHSQIKSEHTLLTPTVLNNNKPEKRERVCRKRQAKNSSTLAFPISRFQSFAPSPFLSLCLISVTLNHW